MARQRRQIFLTPGITSWTVPAGITEVRIRGAGGTGGGGGGAGSGVGAASPQNGGGGGGGGSRIHEEARAVTPGAVISITVGAGGFGGAGGAAGGNPGNPGGTGGVSSFGSAVLFRCLGSGGGNGGNWGLGLAYTAGGGPVENVGALDGLGNTGTPPGQVPSGHGGYGRYQGGGDVLYYRQGGKSHVRLGGDSFTDVGVLYGGGSGGGGGAGEYDDGVYNAYSGGSFQSADADGNPGQGSNTMANLPTMGGGGGGGASGTGAGNHVGGLGGTGGGGLIEIIWDE